MSVIDFHRDLFYPEFSEQALSYQPDKDMSVEITTYLSACEIIG